MKYKIIKNSFFKEINSKNRFFKIPNNWMVKSLGDISIMSSGGTPSKKKEYYGGDILWITTTDLNFSYVLDTQKKITELGMQNSSAKMIPKNTILFAMYGASIGKMGISSIPSCTNQSICCLIPREDVNYLYLYFLLLSNRKKISSLGVGNGQPNISQSVLNNFQCIIPKIKEQNKIVKILEKQETIISNIEKLILKTEKLFEYFLEKLLSGKLLLDINDNIISSKEENIGYNILNGFTTEINKNFNIFKLSDIAKTITGNTPPLNNESLWTDDEESGVKWISTPDLRFQKMGYISSHSRILTNKGIEKARVCPKDTLLISCIATIGEVGLISEDSTFNQQINAILPNEIVNTKYLKYYFLHNKKNFINYAPSSVVKIINKKLFNEFEIFLPPSRDWQDKIVNFLEKQEFLIENQKKLLEKEKQKFEWLSEKLLSGEYLVVDE